MKKKILIIFIVILIVIAGSLFYSNLKICLFAQSVQNRIIEVSKKIVLDALPNATIKEVMIEPSEDYVNFVYDKLYKVHIVYEKKDVPKKIVFNIGVYKDNFITPAKRELLELDTNQTNLPSE